MKRTRVSAIIRLTDFLGAGITVALTLCLHTLPTLFLCCCVCAHNTMFPGSTFYQIQTDLSAPKTLPTYCCHEDTWSHILLETNVNESEF
ncbi:hypothetical protein CR513_56858, partial [Mucuna pruriens]